MVSNRFATYVHQQSLWNRPYFNVLNKTSPFGYSSINDMPGARAFWSEWFQVELSYWPEGWEAEE
jgi:hypothetical protein